MSGWMFNRPAKPPPKPGSTAPEPSPSAGSGPASSPAVVRDAWRGVMPAPPLPPGLDDSRPHRWVNSRHAQLSRVVELDIIPRLMLMHRSVPLLPSTAPALALTADHVQTLAELAVQGESESAASYVRELLTAGATQEQVFLDLLAPCARWMGERWEEDVYSFSQVTIGLWRLQRVLHEQAARPGPPAFGGMDAPRALLAAVPGSQHTFGVSMLGEFFGRAGWDVDCEAKVSWSDLKARLARDGFDVLGLSVSSSEGLTEVASAILDMRKASANPSRFVMVGGPMAASLPDLARLCGADAMAPDAPTAVALAQAMLRPRRSPP